MKKIKIKNRSVGNNEPPFIIAEAGLNHAGNFMVAKEMIKFAHEASADAITYQHIDNSAFNIPSKENQNSKPDWESWRLKDEELEELLEYAKKHGLFTTAGVINKKDLDLVVSLGADFLKIVSGDITCLPFLEECGRTQLPIFMSTGASTLDDVKEAVKTIESTGNENLVIYHTTTNYPTPISEVNLRVLDTLKATFSNPIGFCDHTEGMIIPLAAAAKGVCAIEKHFTLDRNQKGPDYEVSLEPKEFKEMVQKIKIIYSALGSEEKVILKSEKQRYLYSRRSIVANDFIPKGTEIKAEILSYKRPGLCLQPNLISQIIGKTTKCDIKKNEFITLEKVEK